jgi:hypothetical protein
MNDAAGVRRAAERVTLACRALDAAATDLRVTHGRDGLTAVDKAADTVTAETERVCELAQDLAKLASNLRRWAPTETQEQAVDVTVST